MCDIFDLVAALLLLALAASVDAWEKTLRDFKK